MSTSYNKGLDSGVDDLGTGCFTDISDGDWHCRYKSPGKSPNNDFLGAGVGAVIVTLMDWGGILILQSHSFFSWFVVLTIAPLPQNKWGIILQHLVSMKYGLADNFPLRILINPGVIA
ncbi:hypothetical protein Avbf_18227 [Armadillidium vulgare]|nr:hypothetical protein Avbf_18227 [Armadillidium vulgare]